MPLLEQLHCSGGRLSELPDQGPSLLYGNRQVGSHGTSLLRSTATRLPHDDGRIMRYVRGTPAAERVIARR